MISTASRLSKCSNTLELRLLPPYFATNTFAENIYSKLMKTKSYFKKVMSLYAQLRVVFINKKFSCEAWKFTILSLALKKMKNFTSSGTRVVCMRASSWLILQRLNHSRGENNKTSLILRQRVLGLRESRAAVHNLRCLALLSEEAWFECLIWWTFITNLRVHKD